jgi:oligoribonuclease (3'-5' exoribonuclease)
MTSETRVVTPAYLWFDSEFTSLDSEKGRLLQVALVITDAGLRRLTPPAEDVNLCIALAPDTPVSAWVEQNLPDLVARCRSESAVPVEEADRRLSALVDTVVGPVAGDIKRRPVLAGNTVHMDLALVRKFLPGFAGRLHYRLLDVSTVKVLWNDWGSGPVFEKELPGWVEQHLPAGIEVPAAKAHDAYFDIHASIAELNYYRQQMGWGV